MSIFIVFEANEKKYSLIAFNGRRFKFRRRIHFRETAIDATEGASPPDRSRARVFQGFHLHGRLVLDNQLRDSKGLKYYSFSIMLKLKQFKYD